MSPYLQHGSRHARAGSDPIPEPPWAFYGLDIGLVSPGVVANGGTALTNFSSGNFYSSSYETYGTANKIVGGSTYVGPTIEANGMYRWTVTTVAIGDPQTGPFAVSFDTLDFGFSQSWGNPNDMLTGFNWFSVLAGNDGSGTGIGQIFEVQNTTGHNFTSLATEVLIEQLGTFVPDGGYPASF
jgi:hypothetical protein